MKIEAFALLAGLTLMGTGCSNYDDDIRNLNNRVDTIEATVGDLQSQIKAGSVITDVQSNGSGVVIKLSDGKSYTINHGTNGKDGADGKDGIDGINAAVWTIGADGYWYKDDVKTSYKAIGQDGVNGKDGQDGKDGVNGKDGQDGKDGVNGKDGQDGKDGVNGKDGQDGKDGTNGKYYVPNANGFFDIYQDGEFVEATDISWKATGVTAVLNGNTLTLANVDGSEEPVEIFLGEKLLSVAFIPDAISADSHYPTTSYPFYYINEYLDEDEYNQYTGSFIPMEEGWDKSNEVDLAYRINPNDAYVGDDVFATFIGREVVTRAAGDRSGLLGITDWQVAPRQDGVINVVAVLNHSECAETAYDFAALQLWNGSSVVTSDYIHVNGEEIWPRLVEKEAYMNGEDFDDYVCYMRNKSINFDEESDKFVKKFVGTPEDVANYPANFEFKYDSELNLNEVIGLVGFQFDTNNTPIDLGLAEELGFTGIEYEFALPEEYISAKTTDKITNQQACINLENGVVSVKDEWGTAAIGRKPVVRVDVFMNDNHGTRQLVHSSYVKLSIVEHEVSPTLKGSQTLNISEEETLYKNYREIGAEEMIAEMPWNRFNTEIYAQEKLTANNFWNYYGGTEDKYEVILMVENEFGAFDDEDPLFKAELVADGTKKATKGKGFKINVTMNNDDPTTTAAQVFINSNVRTQHTYTYTDAPKYRLQIIFKADDNHAHHDYILQQDIIVKDECEMYAFNPSYYFTPSTIDKTYPGASAFLSEDATDVVAVKGKPVAGVWTMVADVAEWFAKEDGIQTLYDYYLNSNTVHNVADLEFAWEEYPENEVTLTGALTSKDLTVGLAEPMPDKYLVHTMIVTETLKNGEDCEFKYDVVFANPFVGVDSKAQEILGNADLTQELDITKLPLVNNRAGDAIYKANALTTLATSKYGIQNATVIYEWMQDENYEKCFSQINPDHLTLSDGKITWNNGGETLSETHNLTVVVTIEFDDNYVVKCQVPVNLTSKFKK